MLKNNKVKMVLSLLLAVAVWIYVVGLMDPTSKAYYADVPIKLSHVNQLEDRGLAIASCSLESISVTLKGQKSVIAEIEAEDISAKVDVTDLTVGENTCNIIVKAPAKSKVYDQSDMRVTVTVEEIVYAEKDINVVFPEADYPGEEPMVMSQSANKVTVYGAKSLVEKVKRVDAQIDDTNISEIKKTFKANLVPVSKNGKEIKNVSTSSKTIDVVAALLSTKAVPLELVAEGVHSGGIERMLSYPEEITIKGQKDALENIESIKTKVVDVSGIYTDSTLQLELSIPKGVHLSSNNPPLELTVTVNQNASKSFEIDSSKIHVDTDKPYKIEEKAITVTVTGKKDVLKKLNEKSFKLSVSLDDDQPGTKRVNVKCTVDKTLESVLIDPETIHITIEE